MAEEEVKETFNIDKEKNFPEWFSEICKVAELADLRYNVKGFVVYRPWAVIAMKLMYKFYEKALEKRGHKPVIFPAVIPESNFKKEAEHVEGFAPEVFWITEHGAGEKFEEKIALRPTSETAMYSMFSLWVRSYKDLPLKTYQSCQVWRYETKATKAFLRTREFYWIESHDVFATLKEAEDQVKEDMEITKEVLHDIFGIPFIFFQRPEWDKFAGAIHTYAADAFMPSGRVSQLPSTHLLGQNFSKPFNIKFVDKDEREKFAYQTCYGPCISRIFGALISVHGDNKGLKFPWKVSPLQVIIVPIIYKGKEEQVLEKCDELKEKLEKAEIRVDIDKTDKTPGEKFYFWEMKGVPLRLEIGPEEVEKNTITAFRRDTENKEKIKESELIEWVKKTGEEYDKNLIEKADEGFKNIIVEANSYEELKNAIENKKMAKIPFCSVDMDGEPCAEKIKEEMKAEVRGIRMDKKETPKGNCVVCGKKANCVVYVAKQY